MRPADDSLQALQKFLREPPQIAVVLGSGFAGLSAMLHSPRSLPYSEVPHMPPCSVKGHPGEFVVGTLYQEGGSKQNANGVSVCLLRGRAHLYEGHDSSQVVLGLRLLRILGTQVFVLTNASGGINADFCPGDLMLIEDQINLTGKNPLMGENDASLGPRFPDMGSIYTSAFQTIAMETAGDLGLSLKKGVYAGVLGPSYETPAEVRMLRAMGADAVGMSTVHEAVALRHMSARILGLSCIANRAADLSPEPLSHADVEKVVASSGETSAKLLSAVLPRLST